jgi:Predicted membrane protein
MGPFELFLTALALSMDAFAVAICKGLSMKKATAKNSAIVGAYFGIFQAVMPLIGYLIGIQFESHIKSVDHWLAFGLLAIIGINMIREALKKDNESENNADLGFKSMLLLAIATSIDALAVGVTLAFLNVNVFSAVSFIGVTTFILSMVGVKIGSIFGLKFKSKAEIFGGVILILIGAKILAEHLNLITFL